MATSFGHNGHHQANAIQNLKTFALHVPALFKFCIALGSFGGIFLTPLDLVLVLKMSVATLENLDCKQNLCV